MSAANRTRPGRSLILLLLVLAATILWTYWPGASHEARLGLDLRGGTQVILTPELAPLPCTVTSASATPKPFTRWRIISTV